LASEFDGLALEAVGEVFALHGRRASYVPPGGGEAIPCVVTRDSRDPGAEANDGRPLTGNLSVEVRASEIPEPRHGGTFTLLDAGEVYTIVNRPMRADPNGYLWTMWVERQ
jgi:hypothetical protein